MIGNLEGIVKGENWLAHLHFRESCWNHFQKQNVKKLIEVCIIYLTYLHFFDILLLYFPRRILMENKIPESLLNLYESLLSAQLRVVKQLKNPKPAKTKREGEKGMSNMDMAIDILRQARKPLHISEILAQIKTKYKISLDRESLVSALVKKVHRHQGLTRTAPNTFEGTNK